MSKNSTISTKIDNVGRFVKTKKQGVFKRLSKDGKTTFYIKYQDTNRKQVMEKVGLFEEGIREEYCYQILLERKHMTRLGEIPPHLARKRKRKIVTFDDLAQYYFDYLKNRGSSSYKRELSRYKHLAEIAELEASAITRAQIEELVRKKEKEGFSDQSLNLILGLIKTIFNKTIKDKEEQSPVSRNPAENIKKRTVNNIRQGFLTPSECKMLLEEVKKLKDRKLYIFTLLAITTGARPGTIKAIRGVDCDLANSRIYLDNLKANRRYYVPIPEEVVKELEKEIDGLQDLYRYIVGGKEIPEDSRTEAKKLNSVLDRLFNTSRGINKSDRINKITTYSLRHSFGTNLATAGADVLLIQNLLNHSNLSQTQRYAKVTEGLKRDAINGLIEGIL